MARVGGDISHYQTVTNWSDLGKAWDFVFMKATDGNNYVDPKLSDNIHGAQSVGLDLGFYHFARFNNIGDGSSEADFVLDTLNKEISGLSNVFAIVLDAEVNGSNLSPADYNAACTEFINRIKEKSKIEVLLYSYPSFLDSTVGKVDAPLWLADYSSDGHYTKEFQAKGWTVAYVQYTSSGHVAGIDGNVDLDKEIEQYHAKPTESVKTQDPILKLGDKGQAVVEMQTLLAHASFYPNKGAKNNGIDGVYGPNTKDAVERFQKVYLPDAVDGIYGPNTKAQLLKVVKNTQSPQPKVVASDRKYHVVTKGQNLTNIAYLYHTTVSRLVMLNNIKNQNEIYPGQKLEV